MPNGTYYTILDMFMKSRLLAIGSQNDCRHPPKTRNDPFFNKTDDEIRISRFSYCLNKVVFVHTLLSSSGPWLFFVCILKVWQIPFFPKTVHIFLHTLFVFQWDNKWFDFPGVTSPHRGHAAPGGFSTTSGDIKGHVDFHHYVHRVERDGEKEGKLL